MNLSSAVAVAISVVSLGIALIAAVIARRAAAMAGALPAHCKGTRRDGEPCGMTVALDAAGYCRAHRGQAA